MFLVGNGGKMANQGEKNLLMEVEKKDCEKGLVESVFSGCAGHETPHECGENM